MTLFQKKETIVQNIAYMAIMAAINVIFVLLTAVLPPLMFLIVFVLPLTSTTITLLCKKRFFPIYFVVTVALCLIATSGIYIFDTFFYVIPSLITGFIFGILVEKNVPSIYIILISTVIQYALTYLTFFIVGKIFIEINFIDALLSIFGLSEFQFKDVFAHVLIYALASIQTVFTYVFIKFVIRRIGFELNLSIRNKFVPLIVTFVSVVCSVIFLFFYVPLTYVFILLTLPLLIYEIASIAIDRNKLFCILIIVSVFVEVGVFALFYTRFPHPTGIIMLTPLYIFISCIYFANILFMKKTNEDKINN